LVDFQNIKRGTQDVYTRKAAYWHNVRNRSGYEIKWLDRFTASLPAGADLLDLGCGSGDPIARFFLDKGFSVTGVDFAEPLIEIAKKTFPKGRWIVGDIVDLPPLGRFDGIYSWDGFFHLSIDEQRQVLPEIAKQIKRGGSLLLTVGTGEGEVKGQIDDEEVYHASLSPDEYKRILKACGFSQVTYQAEDPDTLGRSLLLASTKSA